MDYTKLQRIIFPVTDGVNSPYTKKKYAHHFKNFLEHYDIQFPQSLLETNDPKYVEGLIIQYIKYLVNERHQKYGTIHHEIAGIMHFFDINGMSLNTKKINKFIPHDETVRDDRAYTHEEIQQILSQCDIRSSVIIYLMASTGMRIGALPGLKLGNLIPIPDYNLYRINVYWYSAGDRYYTFCSPECKVAIDKYLKYRRDFGEDVSNNEAALLREQFDVRDSLKARHSKPQFLTPAGIETLFTRIINKAGLNAKDVMRSHGFRKFYTTAWINANGNYDIRENLLGHKFSRKLGVSYDRTTESDRLREYLRIVDNLTIFSENRLKSRIQSLEHERFREYNVLKSEMEQMKEILDSLNLSSSVKK